MRTVAEGCEIVLQSSLKNLTNRCLKQTEIAPDIIIGDSPVVGVYPKGSEDIGNNKEQYRVSRKKEGKIIDQMPQVISFESTMDSTVEKKIIRTEGSGSTIGKTKSETSIEETLCSKDTYGKPKRGDADAFYSANRVEEPLVFEPFASLAHEESHDDETLGEPIACEVVDADEESLTYYDENRPSRFEELHRLGTQAILLKRTLKYIQVIHESKRSINFEMSWKKKQEKERRLSPRSKMACAEKLFALSKSKQLEGKKIRQDVERRMDTRSKVNDSPFHYIVGFDAKRLSQNATCDEGSTSHRSMYTSLTGNSSIHTKNRLRRSARGAQISRPSPRYNRSVHGSSTCGSFSNRTAMTNITTSTHSSIHDRLYNMSRAKQELGRIRRREIANRIQLKSLHNA